MCSSSLSEWRGVHVSMSPSCDMQGKFFVFFPSLLDFGFELNL